MAEDDVLIGKTDLVRLRHIAESLASDGAIAEMECVLDAISEVTAARATKRKDHDGDLPCDTQAVH